MIEGEKITSGQPTGRGEIQIYIIYLKREAQIFQLRYA